MSSSASDLPTAHRSAEPGGFDTPDQLLAEVLDMGRVGADVAPVYFNRELSWLDYGGRVLALAENPTTPLLDRLKFLAIFSEGLDEFFQVRVAGLKEQIVAGVPVQSQDGLTASEQMERIRERVLALEVRQTELVAGLLLPALRGEGVTIADWSDLSDEDRYAVGEVFAAEILPVLTPLSVDPAHPFPYISNLSLNLAVVVRDPVTAATRFARVKVPALLPRFLQVGDRQVGDRQAFVP